MIVTKPVDLSLLATELTAAGVQTNGLGSFQPAPGETNVHTFDDTGMIIDLPPEAVPVVDAHDGTTRARAATFEQQEDAERLRIINERAQTDPAYAALADLTLGKDR